ncbi:MAG: hypothetical protein K9K65_11760 [Desulfarculaceae bacterium]|nr:hypothetical protein [Desulfarculaceae bacterium]MCF8122316.1 hypothetical protein [Desulfarculaceae bacterium]
MLHVYDETTGAHVESANEGSDMSRWGEGFLVLTADLDDPASWQLVDGDLVPLSEAEALASAKLLRQGELLRVINNFIEAKPNGQVRYDTNLKLNLMQASMAAMAAGQAIPAVVTSAKSWISAVQGRYFVLKADIAAVDSLASLGAIDLSYEALEAAFGVAGTVLADPDVTTADLAAE